MGQDIFFNIDSRSDLYEVQPVPFQREDSAFREVKGLLARFSRIGATVCYMLYLFDDFFDFPLPDDLQFTTPCGNFKSLGSECAVKEDLFCVLRNVDEPTAA